MNPFEEKPSKKLTYSSWEKLYPESYNKNEVDPYTKTRIILMYGIRGELVCAPTLPPYEQ